MDSANNLSQSILQSSEATFPSASSGTVSSDGSSGFFDTLKSINLTTWIIIFFILAFLGFNIFVYLAKGTQDITNFFTPLFQKIQNHRQTKMLMKLALNHRWIVILNLINYSNYPL